MPVYHPRPVAPPVRVGDAVLHADWRTLRGPGGVAILPPQAARLLARLAARPGAVVPWADVVEAVYAGADPEADDPRQVARVLLYQIRHALRDAAAGAGIATVFGTGPRLDVPARGEGARVEPRPVSPRHARMVRARDQGVAPADIAERFGFASANSARVMVYQARRRLRAEAAPDAGSAR